MEYVAVAYVVFLVVWVVARLVSTPIRSEDEIPVTPDSLSRIGATVEDRNEWLDWTRTDDGYVDKRVEIVAMHAPGGLRKVTFALSFHCVETRANVRMVVTADSADEAWREVKSQYDEIYATRGGA